MLPPLIALATTSTAPCRHKYTVRLRRCAQVCLERVKAARRGEPITEDEILRTSIPGFETSELCLAESFQNLRA